jgi:small subunit ribosomal protein S8e
MKYQGRSPRKRTGGRRRPFRNKRKHELGHESTETQVGEPTFKTVDSRGNTSKVRAIATDTASVAVDGDVVAAEIENVDENPANPNYARRNIITRGAILETSEGRVKVTSRPGQDGQVNAVLVDDAA